jgi:hypothetical protein
MIRITIEIEGPTVATTASQRTGPPSPESPARTAMPDAMDAGSAPAALSTVVSTVGSDAIDAGAAREQSAFSAGHLTTTSKRE